MLLVRIFDADRADDTVLAGVSVLIEQIDVVDRGGFAHGAGADFHPRKIGQQHRGFRLAEALVNAKPRLALDLIENLGVERARPQGRRAR